MGTSKLFVPLPEQCSVDTQNWRLSDVGGSGRGLLLSCFLSRGITFKLSRAVLLLPLYFTVAIFFLKEFFFLVVWKDLQKGALCTEQDPSHLTASWTVLSLSIPSPVADQSVPEPCAPPPVAVLWDSPKMAHCSPRKGLFIKKQLLSGRES